MKKLLIASLIAMSTSAAHAYDSATQMHNIEICREVANLAETGYQNRTNYGVNPVDDENRNSWMGGILMWAYDYGHDRAADQRDAHMVAFGKCIDNINFAAHRSPGSYMTEAEVEH